MSQRRQAHTAAAALLLIAGGGAAAAAWHMLQGPIVVILIGGSLSLAGARNARDRWVTGVGLPILGLGMGVALSTMVAPLAGYMTSTAFIGMGGGLMLAEQLGSPAWALIAGVVLIDLGIAAATVSIGDWHPWQASGWVFGVAEALAGVGLLARTRGAAAARSEGRGPAQAARTARPESSPRQAVAVFGGAVGVAAVDQFTGNLYQVVFALGVAYLGAGVIANHRGWRQSGALLTALGAAITLTDFVPEAVSAIHVLVFTAILVAAVGLGVFGGGSVGGLGRSLVVIGLVLAALAGLPSLGPIDLLRRHLDVLLPLGPAVSAVAISVRLAAQRISART